eukprot:jgi/Bigna1/89993/estExt_fgenesh1_pg.C_600003
MHITALYGGALTLWYLVLTARVILYRRENLIGLGDGNNNTMQRRIRAHGNFAEYVPLVGWWIDCKDYLIPHCIGNHHLLDFTTPVSFGNKWREILQQPVLHTSYWSFTANWTAFTWILTLVHRTEYVRSSRRNGPDSFGNGHIWIICIFCRILQINNLIQSCSF